jgi:hypothetical protein
MQWSSTNMTILVVGMSRFAAAFHRPSSAANSPDEGVCGHIGLSAESQLLAARYLVSTRFSVFPGR